MASSLAIHNPTEKYVVMSPSPLPSRTTARLGTVLLMLGSLAFVIIAVPTWRDAITWRGFHTALPIWLLFSIAAIAIGLRLLWKADYAGTDWSPSQPGQRFRTAVLYSRENCPLCDEAEDLLRRYSRYLAPLSIVDISSDSELTAIYGTSIPVVEFDGEIHFRGCVSEVLLRRLIRMTEPE